MHYSKRIIAALLFGPTMSMAQTIDFDIVGDDEVIANAVRSASLVLSINADETPDPQDYIAAARADYRRILTALYGQGRYSGAVSILVDGREAAGIAPLAAPSRIDKIALRIDPGPSFTFGNATVDPLPSGTLLPESFARGEVAASKVIVQAVAEGVGAWRDNGYAKAAAIDQQVTARHAEQTLDVAITLAPGPQLTFGTLTITGNTAVRTARIAKIAGLPEGEIYSPEEITRAERRLRKTGAFDSIAAVEADQIGPDNTLPIELQVVESAPRRFGFGLDLSSIEGLEVSAYWMHRNFMSGAERFRVDAGISGIGGSTGGTDYALGLSFERPAVYGPDTDFFLRAQISREDEPDYLVDKISVETGLNRLIADELATQIGVGVLTAREVTPSGTREYTLITLPLAATLDRRDTPTNATEGYYINLEATPFYDTTNDLFGGRIFADARAYRSFGSDDKITFAGRAQIGSVVGTTIENAPADFLFYSGGGGTVRGQPYKTLGVNSIISGEDVRTGGQSFLGAQLEARYAVTGKIGLVGFYDFGQVGADASFGGNSDWHAGAGLGLRYDTGIGPIRLDIATPASGDDIASSVQVYIGIGQSF
ncbi:MAG: outer membrane protein assembly factor [Yoonia sp.]|nr:outer membrane protein assembly factor [Yoonia sp.]